MALAMVLGMFPAWAVAEEVDAEPGDEAVVEVQGEGDGDVADGQDEDDGDVAEAQGEDDGDDAEEQAPEMTLTAQADNTGAYNAYLVTQSDTTTTLPNKVVSFNGIAWYIIKDESTALNAGSVTLLAKDCLGTTQFNYQTNAYKGSFVETWLKTYYTENFSSVDSAVASLTPSNPDGNAAKLYLLSTGEIPSSAEYLKCTTDWWLRSAGTTGYTEIRAALVNGSSGLVNSDGDQTQEKRGVRPALKLNLSKVVFDSTTKTFSLHTHSFTYSHDGATITATCTATGCTLKDSKATLTIVKPTLETYGGEGVASATLDGLEAFNSATGKGVAESAIVYVGRDGTTYAESKKAPEDAGKYTASVTVEGQPASVDYEIAKAGQEKLDEEEARRKSGIDYEDETLTPDEDVEVSPTNGPTTDDEAPGVPSLTPVLDAGGDPVIYVRRKAPDDNHKPSEWVAVPLAPRPPAPTGLTKEDATDGRTADGKINGTDDGMEYSGDGGRTWKPVTADPTLVPAGTYLVRTRATADAPHGRPAEVTVGAAVPAAPAKVSRPSTEGHPGAGTFDVAWKAADGAKSYEVQWRKKGGKWQTKTVRSRKYTISGLKKGTLYEVRVRAKAGSATGEWSSASRRWLRGPDRVRVRAGSKSGTVKVSWKKDKKATAGTKVYVYSKKGGKLVKAAKAKAGKTSVTIDGLKAGKRYYVRVRPLRKASGRTYAGTLCSHRAVRAAK